MIVNSVVALSKILLLLLVTITVSASGQSQYGTVKMLTQNSIWNTVASEYKVDPVMLYSIALAESRRLWSDGFARPWPWVINSRKHGPKWFITEKDAVAFLNKMIFEEGDDEVAIGLMQIWYPENGYLMPSPEELINPVNNIRAGAFVYKEALKTTNDQTGKALGMYNSGKALENEYSQQVLSIYNGIRKTLTSGESNANL